MVVMIMDDETRKDIERLRDKYQDKAEEYWINYQDGATKRSLSAYYRNQYIADALELLLLNKNPDEKYRRLVADVMEISTWDYQTMVHQVETIKASISNGAYLK